MIPFYQTGYGRKFFDHQLPATMQALADIASELKRANDLKERELHAQKSEETMDN